MTCSTCGFAIFDECDPETCERDCFTARVINLNAAHHREATHSSAIKLLAIGVVATVLSLGFLAAANWGMARQAELFRAEARV